MTSRGYKGRGAISAPPGRFSSRSVEFDEVEAASRAADAPVTTLRPVQARRILSTNTSPDVPFDVSINPYQGCEHGCVYCYARPSHSYLDLSPGLDFETQVFYKANASARLLEAWEKPGYQCKPITIGANTDPYQPAERIHQVTRQLLELFVAHRHPVSIVTKGHLVLRDIDLLATLAGHRLTSVAISLPTLSTNLKRIMEPRAPSAEARLRALQQLSEAGVPCTVLVAPIIPAINDGEIEQILARAAAAGALQARYIFLRLPLELKSLFVDWLEAHFADRAGRVRSLVRQATGGNDYDSRFHVRQRGQGPYADMIAARFDTVCKKLGLNAEDNRHVLDCNQFVRPGPRQLGLAL